MTETEALIAAYRTAQEKIDWLILSLQELPIDKKIWLDLQGIRTDCELLILELRAQHDDK